MIRSCVARRGTPALNLISAQRVAEIVQDGAVSQDAFYERVKEWTLGLPAEGSGPLPNGAYIIRGAGRAADVRNDGLMINGNSAAVDAELVEVSAKSGLRDIVLQILILS